MIHTGNKIPLDAQEYKDKLNSIKNYVEELKSKTSNECIKYSEDVKHWAVYKTGIKEFTPWIDSAEHISKVGLTKKTKNAIH